ncbi:MAG TPA: CopG family transcriptional regulator [Thermoanaerobaculia bacterium]|nr:CopG family transcriptional regulator [Thermoanaerobaculia bacterium]
MAEDIRYNVTLPESLNRDLESAAGELGITKAEAIRRAILLMKHAVKADKVELTSGNEKQTVLVK